MNFTHLTSIYPDKSPLQIYEFLSTAMGTYVDIATGIVVNERRAKMFILEDGKELDIPILEHQAKTNRDLYQNSITNLSWKNLDLYLDHLYTIENLDQATFIIDIATRNCIPLRTQLYTDMLRFRQHDLFIQYRYAWLKKSLEEIFDEANDRIYKILNVLIHKDAFVRY